MMAVDSMDCLLLMTSVHSTAHSPRHCEEPTGRNDGLEPLRPQNNAIARRTRDRKIGRLCCLQRIDCVRLDRKRLEMTADEAETEFPEDGSGRTRRQPKRIDADIGVLAAVKFENIELHDPIDGGDQNLTSPQGQRLVCRLEI